MSIIQITLDPPIAPAAPVTTFRKSGEYPDYFKIFSKDPSPWYLDSDTWTKLLYKIARGEGFHSFFNLQALASLHSIRRFGCMIKWDMHRGYRLIPDLELGVWETQEYWDYCKRTYFMDFAQLWKRWFYFIDE